ncbi:MAG: acyl carrier protein [Saprospiraceae bacterium]|nr:acyl carrier protein [Saprospiraceae bacterium]
MSHFTMNDIEQKLCNFIEYDLLEEAHRISPDTPLLETGIDSLSIIEILLFAERTFHTTLPDSILTKENLQTVSHFAQCIYPYLHDPS